MACYAIVRSPIHNHWNYEANLCLCDSLPVPQTVLLLEVLPRDWPSDPYGIRSHIPDALLLHRVLYFLPVIRTLIKIGNNENGVLAGLACSSDERNVDPMIATVK